LSLGVAIYTGVLLGAVQARPFWNTNLVAQMFLFSGLSTGCAALILALSMGRNRPGPTQIRFLYTLDVCLILLELLIVTPYLLHGELSIAAVRNSLDLILGGPFTFLFWICFLAVGLLAPLTLEVWEMRPSAHLVAHHNRRLGAAAAVLILAGGFFLRYIFVYAGQISRFDQ
jgi:formate-dependent nitrite reductase membrane component NrfD